MAKSTEVWKGVIVMDNLMQKIKKKLALLLILVLLFNNTSILNLFVYAQGDGDITVSGNDTTSGGDLSGGDSSGGGSVSNGDSSGGSVSNGDSTGGSVSNGDSTGDGSVSDGDSTDDDPVSGGGTVSGGDSIVLKFNDGLEDFWNQEEEKYYLVYGSARTLDCSVSVQEDETQDTDGTVEAGHITYTVKDVLDADGNEVDAEGSQIASISNDGILTFCDGMVGTIEVKASMDEMENYASAEVTCQIVVAYENVLAPSLVLKNQDGDSIEDNEAYNHTVYVCPPKGYQISESNSFFNGAWSENIEISQEGKNEKTFYLRNTETNGISEGIEKIIYINMQIPKLTEVEFSQWYVAERVNDDGSSFENKEYLSDDYTLTIDDGKNVKLYYNEDVDMVFTVRGEENEVNAITYKVYKDNNEIEKELTWIQDEEDSTLWTATDNIAMDDEGLYYVTLEYKDEAGNEFKYRSEYICIPENADFVNVEYSDWQYAEDIEEGKEIPQYTAGSRSDVKLYYNDSMTMTFRIAKKNLVEEYITVEDSYPGKGKVTLVWEKDGDEDSDIWKAVYPIPETEVGEHVVSLVYKRINSNEPDIDWKSEKINIIDTTLPKFESVDYSGWIKVENAQGEVLQGIGNGDINETMHVFAKGEVTLDYLFTEANEGDMRKLKVYDMFNGDSTEIPDIKWSNSEDSPKEWRTTTQISNQGKHVIVIKYQKDNGDEEEIVSSATIYVDSAEAKLNSVIYSVSSGDPVEIIPEGETLEGDGVTRYYKENMEVEFVLDEQFFYETDLTITDSYYKDSEDTLSYSVNSKDGKTYIVCAIPKGDEGLHEVTLNYWDKIYDTNVFYKTTIVMDKTPPEMYANVDYSPWISAEDSDPANAAEYNLLIEDRDSVLGMKNVRLFYNDDMTISFFISEDNFFSENFIITDTYPKSKEDMQLEFIPVDAGGKNWKVIYTIPKYEEGDHVVSISYTDSAGNVALTDTSKIICMDVTPANRGVVTYSEPVYSINYREETAETENTDASVYYNGNMSITFKIKEENFRCEDVKLIDSDGKDIENDKSSELIWNDGSGDDTGYKVAKYCIKEEGEHIVTLEYKERASGNVIINYTSKKIIIDTTKPEDGGILYSDTVKINEKKYYKEDATISFVIIEKNFHREGVTLSDSYTDNYDSQTKYTQADEVAGQERLEYIQDRENPDKWIVRYTIPEEEYGTHEVTLTYNDPCQNDEIVFHAEPIIMDEPTGDMTEEYIAYYVYEIDDIDNGKRVYINTSKEDIQVKFTIPEDNFFSQYITFSDSYYESENIELEWNTTRDGVKVTATYPISWEDEGKHVLKLHYDDPIENGDVDYICEVIVDSLSAEITEVVYSEGVDSESTDSGEIIYYNKATEAKVTFKIDEIEFEADNLRIVNHLDGKEIENKNIEINTTVFPVEVTCTIPNKTDGDYQLELIYNAKSNISTVSVANKVMIVDNTPAEKGTVEYSEWENAEYVADAGYGRLVESEDIEERNDIILYYKSTSESADDNVEVTFNIKEKNFHTEGITVLHNGVENPDISWSVGSATNDNTYPVTCLIPKSCEGDHVITLSYHDRCKNGEALTFISKVIRIDNQEAKYKADYSGWVSAWCVNTDSGVGEELLDYECATRDDVYLYCKDPIILTFDITEKYFCENDVVFSDDYDSEVDNAALDWEPVEGQADTWRATYKISDEGKHIVRLSYQDRSLNEPAINYVSEQIIIDKSKADLSNIIFEGKYHYAEDMADNGKKLESYIIDSSDDVKLYYNSDMIIKFEITEANFNPEDVELIDEYNGEKHRKDVVCEQSSEPNKYIIICKIPVAKAGKHVVTLTYQDRALNGPAISYISEHIIMDEKPSEFSESPVITKWENAEDINTKEILDKYEDEKEENNENNKNNVRLYYNDNMSITFKIREDNFHESDVIFVDHYEGKDNSIVLDWQPGTGVESNIWTATHTIHKDEEGEHLLTLSYSDRSGNKGIQYTSERILMDAADPELSGVSFSVWKQAVESDTLAHLPEYEVRKSEDVNLYYDDSMIMTFVIKEANFNEDDVIIKDNEEELPYTLNWQPGTGENSNVWTATHTIQKEGKHIITIQYNDRSGNEMQMYTSEKIIIDTHVPEVSLGYREDLLATTVVGDVSYYGDNQVVKICIKEDNFRASDVEITINTEDALTEVDVDAINTNLKNPSSWNETVDGYVAYIDLDIDAKYDIAVDYTDLAMWASKKASTSLVVDNVKPVAVEVDAEVAYNTALCKRMVDNNNATVTTADDDTRFIYQDAMTFKFVLEEVNFNAEDVEVLVFRDGVQLVNGDGYQYKYDVHWSTEENPYIHILSLEIGKKDGELVDGDYQVKINYKDLAGHDMSPYISNIITIDHTEPVIIVNYDNHDVNNESFYNKERVATITVMDRNVVPGEIEVGVTAKDIDGNVLAYDIAAKQSPWIAGEEPYTWVSTITYDIDANYEFAMVCKDMATNEDDESDSFTVDKTAPDKESFRFVYSTPILDGAETDSNNAFYKDKVTVKIVAEDIISPIDYFEWTYIKQPGTSSVNQELETHIIHNSDKGFSYDATKRTATAEFTLTAEEAKQYRGNLRFSATDMAGNTSEELTDTERIVIVDTIAPTRTVEYSPANQIVNKDTLNTLTGFDYSLEGMGVALLYNKPMTITFKVNEANFYANDIVVKVNNTARNITNWSKAGDVWTGNISIAEDGEYIVTLQYTDRSTNEMVDYTSHLIIVDTVKPQIQVSYGPDDVKQEVEGIKYYDKQLTATITIVEHNFRAEDVEAIVKATDISGNSIDVMDYAAYLKNRNNWEKQGDKHIAKIIFEKDANYEFDIDYMDLALQPADDYANDVFTVDQTAPTNVAVSYSAPVFEKTLQGTTYEFYKDPITVTITAEDEVSGVYGFDYSYIRKDGVSSVNAEGIINKIEVQRITYSKDKKTATATFVIPASELSSGTQLNGNMEFVVNNRSMLTTEYKDPRRYVVDNIAPNVTVEFSDCVQKANNISYYAGDIDVTIAVDEANFYEEDVVVSISKDGGAPYAADVSWRTETVDRHIGSITLEDEGNYRVYVSYQDPSTNKMEDYQSNLLIIDKTQPDVIVSGIKHNSANKQEQIGFVVKVEDLNLNTNSFSPKLIAEIKDESGNIRQVDCTELGTIETVVAGKSCTYTINNISQDGIYHLSCLVSDMSGNTTESMVIEDSKKQIREQLDYSVNRNGSTYGLEENTKKLINRFVKEARDVVIYETNPDEISNIKITLFKNDKTIILEEGKDYIVNLISEEGEWYKYEYIIFATNFMEDGTYRISIYSEDKAGNIAENNLDVKNVEISFGVDKTLPNLIVTNLESKTTYPLDKLSVLMRATDNMKLSNITVELDGKIVATWDEEQIQQMSSSLQDFVFDIMGNETKAHTVIITLTDIAGNQLVETISDFYVTRNLWVRFTNNKILFYGSIIACLTTGFLFILLWKRRKKRNDANG